MFLYIKAYRLISKTLSWRWREKVGSLQGDKRQTTLLKALKALKNMFCLDLHNEDSITRKGLILRPLQEVEKREAQDVKRLVQPLFF